MGSFVIEQAESIVLISHYTDLKVTLTPDNTDFTRIIELCRGNMHKDRPACPFGACEVQFIQKDRTVSVFPATDGCGHVAIGNVGNNELTLIFLADEAMTELKHILNKYGIVTEGA